MYYDQILHSIHHKTARVGVIGLGHVGAPLLLLLAEKRFHVTGIDIDQEKLQLLIERKSPFSYLDDETLQQILTSSNCFFTDDFSVVSDLDVIVICVPTPLGANLGPDLSSLISSLDALLPYVKKGQIISLESTTYPGTTEKEIVSRLESRGFSVGQDVFVVFSPERVDPGNNSHKISSIPKILGGFTENCQKVGTAFYSSFVDKVVPVSSLKTAELTKLLENIYRAVNIGLVNELKIVSDKLDVDIWEVIEAASTKPFGYVPFYPGPGLGGHCLPIDPFYLSWKAKELGLQTPLIEEAGKVNRYMPEWVVNKIFKALNSQAKSVNGSRVLILGIAYKKGINDFRESPAIEILERLTTLGAELSYHDPYIPHLNELGSIKFDEKNIASYDAVVLVTDHDCFDYQMIWEHAQLIIDTRNRFKIKNSKLFRA